MFIKVAALNIPTVLTMKFLVQNIFLLSLITCALCTSFFFGQKTNDTKMIHREKVVYYAVPWKKRVQNYSYNDSSQRPIKAIDCHDYQHTEALVDITEGGIGFPYVSLRLKSQRSYGLEYAIEIFA